MGLEQVPALLVQPRFPLLPIRDFVYFDIPQHLSLPLFQKHDVRVRLLRESRHREAPYVAVYAQARKKDMLAVCTALMELPDKMLLCGYRDYNAFVAAQIDKLTPPAEKEGR